jgi:uncharacterized protein (DUF2147 family)
MRGVVVGLIVAVLGFAGAQAQAQTKVADASGRWRTQMHHALVDISACADGAPCGVLVWVDPAIAHGVTTDQRNPDRRLRSRPLNGLVILSGLRPNGTGWSAGQVYNPDTGQTFRASARLEGADALRVTGCLGLLCRSELWIRVSRS